ncbi:hypothetical protein J4Q44_G00370390 [Coregonus suidteri]|uniref:Uncharacterized protein n=1 Tax=Coregonus suidteri TaxID=861788 RepID=A0AAN8KNN5_9TELE
MQRKSRRKEEQVSKVVWVKDAPLAKAVGRTEQAASDATPTAEKKSRFERLKERMEEERKVEHEHLMRKIQELEIIRDAPLAKAVVRREQAASDVTPTAEKKSRFERLKEKLEGERRAEHEHLIKNIQELEMSVKWEQNKYAVQEKALKEMARGNERAEAEKAALQEIIQRLVKKQVRTEEAWGKKQEDWTKAKAMFSDQWSKLEKLWKREKSALIDNAESFKKIINDLQCASKTTEAEIKMAETEKTALQEIMQRLVVKIVQTEKAWGNEQRDWAKDKARLSDQMQMMEIAWSLREDGWAKLMQHMEAEIAQKKILQEKEAQVHSKSACHIGIRGYLKNITKKRREKKERAKEDKYGP